MNKQDLSILIAKKELSDKLPKEKQDEIIKEILAEIDEEDSRHYDRMVVVSIILIVIMIMLPIMTALTSNKIFVYVSVLFPIFLFNQAISLIIRPWYIHISKGPHYTRIGIIFLIIPFLYLACINFIFHLF